MTFYYFFNLKNSVAEAHGLLIKTYDKVVISVEILKVYEDLKLEALLDETPVKHKKSLQLH